MLATGQQLTINVGGLGATETMVIDGSAEASGSLRLIAGAAADTLTGGDGADALFGGLGADTLEGGGGADLFRYTNVAQSGPASRDFILDFVHGTDILDFAGIDANSLSGGNQAFSYIGSTAFAGTGAASAGELRATVVSGTTWLVAGDTNGDGIADFEVNVTMAGMQQFTVGDFLL